MKKHLFFIALVCTLLVGCKPDPVLPTVKTHQVQDITETTVYCLGDVTDSGNATIIAEGFCWSTTQDPTLENGFTTEADSRRNEPVPPFTATITGLNPNTTYYVRAYATNEVGTAYGENVSFTTLEADDNGGDDNGGDGDEIIVELPTVTTSSITEITQTTALAAGNVTADGGAEVTARGVCWSTNQNPTIESSFTTEDGGMGEFTSHLNELMPNTTYYVRAYATNSEGTNYGEELSFTTLEAGTIVVLPTVTTVTVSEITVHTAMITAEVLTDGGADVTERGFLWKETYWDGTSTLEPNRVIVGEGLGSYSHMLTGLMEETEYYVCAYAVNSAGEIVGDPVHFTTLKDDSGDEIEYTYVDLGLPSGTKWAEHNVGTVFPEGYGDFFAWGEIDPKTEYTSDNCSSYNEDLGDISGNPQYDPAAAYWGDGWRMPTLEEMYELTQECTWTWTEVNGVPGHKVTSKTNGNHIFLPASGFRVNDQLIDQNVYGYYWMSTPYEEEGSAATYTKACFLDMCSYQYICNWSLRRNGMTIRPVKD